MIFMKFTSNIRNNLPYDEEKSAENNGNNLRKLVLQQPWKHATEIVRRENRRKHHVGMMELNSSQE
jgi:hypothetical protein